MSSVTCVVAAALLLAACVDYASAAILDGLLLRSSANRVDFNLTAADEGPYRVVGANSSGIGRNAYYTRFRSDEPLPKDAPLEFGAGRPQALFGATERAGHSLPYGGRVTIVRQEATIVGHLKFAVMQMGEARGAPVKPGPHLNASAEHSGWRRRSPVFLSLIHISEPTRPY